MKGATKYARLFKTGQYGKLYITSGSHARGETFEIQVLPQGEKAKPNGECNKCLNSDAIEVYGVVSGNPGWTEEYGWIHKGKWQEDFEALVLHKEMEEEIQKKLQVHLKRAKEQKERERTNNLLSHY